MCYKPISIRRVACRGGEVPQDDDFPILGRFVGLRELLLSRHGRPDPSPRVGYPTTPPRRPRGSPVAMPTTELRTHFGGKVGDPVPIRGFHTVIRTVIDPQNRPFRHPRPPCHATRPLKAVVTPNSAGRLTAPPSESHPRRSPGTFHDALHHDGRIATPERTASRRAHRVRPERIACGPSASRAARAHRAPRHRPAP